jgi:hypothetical protein
VELVVYPIRTEAQKALLANVGSTKGLTSPLAWRLAARDGPAA